MECCATCRYLLKLTMFDYSHGGCQHWPMGYVCTVLDDEAAFLCGSDLEHTRCEGYIPAERWFLLPDAQKEGV